VFAFGKSALEALLGSTQPTPKHWKKLPEWLADLLARCVDEDFYPDNPDDGRFRDFAPILEILSNPPPVTPPTPSVPPPSQNDTSTQTFTDADFAEFSELAGAIVAKERAAPPNPAKHRYTCHKCLFQWDIPVPLGGEVANCPSCETKFILMPQDTGATPPKPVQPAKPAAFTKLRTTCPLCSARFRFPPKRGGERVKCPQRGMWLILPTQDGGTALISPTPVPESVSQRRKAGDKFYLPLPGGLWMAFAWCPSGAFLMGSPEWEEGRDEDELQREVRLTKGFYCGVHPVTRGEFARFVAQTKFETDAEATGGGYGWTGVRFDRDPAANWRNPGFTQTDDHPVTVVSWNDAVAFCRWLETRTGHRVRLPTEAEWEYACRGGTTTPFYWGRELNGTQANSNGYCPYGTETTGPYLKKTSPVDCYPKKFPHPWGLADAHGNVWEWCADWFDEEFYARSPKNDPECQDGQQLYRIARGGSWYDYVMGCRAATRFRDSTWQCIGDLGFRVVFCPV
jgi:formylglycine-generating enzyme required for sulfatase activity